MYEAGLVVGERDIQAALDVDGALLENKEVLGVEALPATVAEAVRGKLPGIVFTGAEKLTLGGKARCDIRGVVGKRKFQVKVSEEGSVVRIKKDRKRGSAALSVRLQVTRAR